MDVKEMLRTEWQNIKQLRYLQIEFDTDRCIGAWQCYEVCPVGRWTPNYDTRVAVLNDTLTCIACGACVEQCPEEAIRLIVE